MRLSRKKNFARGEGFAWLKTADLQLKKEGTDSLDIYYQKAIAIGQKLKDHFLTGPANNHLGYIQERQGEYELATQHNLLAISLFDKVGNAKEAANTLGNQAVVFYKLGRKDEALAMFKQSGAKRETLADVKGLAATYGNIVTVYTPINTDLASKYLALQLANAENRAVG